jgi:hypothetical protein
VEKSSDHIDRLLAERVKLREEVQEHTRLAKEHSKEAKTKTKRLAEISRLLGDESAPSVDREELFK